MVNVFWIDPAFFSVLPNVLPLLVSLHWLPHVKRIFTSTFAGRIVTIIVDDSSKYTIAIRVLSLSFSGSA